MSRFEIGATDFLLDGRPHRILSGALHYFRVHPDEWADRIRKARLLGLNAVETYVAWNAHEPRRGEWDVTGANDLGRFLDLVAAEGMHAIVRPGPYICAEWHNGGLPVWLTAMPGIGLRRSEPQYMAEVEVFLRRVYDIVAPRQLDAGGSVILVQIENEYGAYGSDKDYLAELVRITKDAGITVPLTTVDQPQPDMLRDGSLPGVHLTGSFGSRASERLATLREHQPTGPLMCSEFWDGWFDWWGSVHHTTSPAESAAELETMLAAGASVNLYMFHGGTNFGLTTGANHKGRYLPIATSYDYDAPLDEAGHPTEKYWAFREVIARHAPVPDDVPDAATPAPAFEVALEPVGDWARAADGPTTVAAQPPVFEDVDPTVAIVRYETALPPGDGLRSLVFGEVRDRAWVEVDGVPVGALSRTRGERSLAVPPGGRLTVVVEEEGRVNYGVRIGEPKGIVGPVTLDGEVLSDWTATPIDVAAVDAWVRDADAVNGPAAGRVALRGSFTLDAAADLILDTGAWGSGVAIVNGFVLGRYASAGPQRTLRVPGPVVRAGANAVVVVELADAAERVARFVAEPALGPTED
ncbi:beta-galactosidase [Microbacter sp. GSS18]|nr:beta-galactosidase [Microbacter sp. GSS18]